MNEDRARICTLTLGILFTVAITLGPVLYMLLTSFSRSPDFLIPGGEYLFTLENYRTILFAESVHFLYFLRNSFVVSGVSAAICVFVASLAAYAITRTSLPGKAFLMFSILAISMFPPVSLVGYLFKFTTALGWINTYQALIFPYVAWSLPLSLWILVSYFAQVPKDLDKAGLIDGCTRLQILFKIVFPVAAPGIFSTLLLAFVFSFNEFLFALMLTTDRAARTIPVGIALFEGLHGQIPWGEIMAAASVATVPVIVLTLFFQRRIIQGLTRGAVKE
jgi:multiple sugar transport system permease protein